MFNFYFLFNAINFYETPLKYCLALAMQVLDRVAKVQQVKNNAFYLEFSDRGFQECNESRADVGLGNRFGFPTENWTFVHLPQGRLG